MDIDPQKLEILRSAFPRGLSAGDGGLTVSKGSISPQEKWPQFQSSIIESKVYSRMPQEEAIVQQQQQSGVSSSIVHPWKVTLLSEDDTTFYKVEYNSNLYSSIASWTKIEVTGLDFPSEMSEGFLTLFGVVVDGVCTEASIQGPEAIPSDRIDFVGDDQNSFAVQIAYLYLNEDGGWSVRQLAFSDLTIVDFCVNGKPAIYPIAI